jgi:hypothetical protein
MTFRVEFYDALTDTIVTDRPQAWNGFRKQSLPQAATAAAKPSVQPAATAATVDHKEPGPPTTRSGRVSKPPRPGHLLRSKADEPWPVVEANELDLDWLKMTVEAKLRSLKISISGKEASANREQRKVIRRRLRDAEAKQPVAIAAAAPMAPSADHKELAALVAAARPKPLDLEPLYLDLARGTLCFVVKKDARIGSLDATQQAQAWLAVLAHLDMHNRFLTYRIVKQDDGGLATLVSPTLVAAAAAGSAGAASTNPQPMASDRNDPSSNQAEPPKELLQALKRVSLFDLAALAKRKSVFEFYDNSSERRGPRSAEDELLLSDFVAEVGWGNLIQSRRLPPRQRSWMTATSRMHQATNPFRLSRNTTPWIPTQRTGLRRTSWPNSNARQCGLIHWAIS